MGIRMRFAPYVRIAALATGLFLVAPAFLDAQAVKKPGAKAPAAKAAPAKPAAAKPTASRKQGSLGSKEPGLFNLTGSIYFLPKNARGMPADLATQKVEGTIYTDRLDVPVRQFTSGFPGVTDRYEWFGILYTGRFFAPVEGEYTWMLRSDDGSHLWVDGQTVINYDFVHGFGSKLGKNTLTAGPHDIAVWYFQGPATQIGLQLSVQPPGAKGMQIFDLADFAGPMANAVKTLKAEATPDGIRVRLDAALLFDTAKWDLKPKAQQAIKNLGAVISGYAAANIRVSGYTDSVGGDDYNLDLSRSRAQSVKDALVAQNPPAGVTFETDGRGKADPVATNDTAEGRQMNRRVEVFIKPLASQAFFEATAMERVQNQREVKLQRESQRPQQATEKRSGTETPAQQPGTPEVPKAAAADAAKTYQAAPTPRAVATPGAPRTGTKTSGPELTAAIARVKDVLARYAAALTARDLAALERVREPISDAERALLGSSSVSVSLTVVDVDVTGTEATASCQQAVEMPAGGTATRTNVVARLVRKPSGWVITEIK